MILITQLHNKLSEIQLVANQSKSDFIKIVEMPHNILTA